jgi:hypothetical protein
MSARYAGSPAPSDGSRSAPIASTDPAINIHVMLAGTWLAKANRSARAAPNISVSAKARPDVALVGCSRLRTCIACQICASNAVLRATSPGTDGPWTHYPGAAAPPLDEGLGNRREPR